MGKKKKVVSVFTVTSRGIRHQFKKNKKIIVSDSSGQRRHCPGRKKQQQKTKKKERKRLLLLQKISLKQPDMAQIINNASMGGNRKGVHAIH